MSPEAPVQTILTCSQCGRSFAHSDLVQIAGNWVCADCKPAFLSRVMASGAAGASPLSWRYGGFWIHPLRSSAYTQYDACGKSTGTSADQPSVCNFRIAWFLCHHFSCGRRLRDSDAEIPQRNSWKDGVRVDRYPFRRPYFKLGRMLWALLYVEYRYQRHSLLKFRPHAG